MFQRIMLAIDGSLAANRAADYVGALALRFHSQIIVVSAYTVRGQSKTSDQDEAGVQPVPKNIPLGLPLFQSHAESEAAVQIIVEQFGHMGITEVETYLIEGPPANVILGVEETYQPDLIVLGARGQGIWQGASLGSVSNAIVQRATSPVLVVR